MPKILIIDDEDDIIEFTTMALEAHGFDVISASHGEAGIEKANVENPDVVLLDVMMPGMDGFEVCTLLKSNTKTKHIPVLMISAKAQQQDIAKGKNAGCNDYVTKPFELKDLVVKIKEYL